MDVLDKTVLNILGNVNSENNLSVCSCGKNDMCDKCVNNQTKFDKNKIKTFLKKPRKFEKFIRLKLGQKEFGKNNKPEHLRFTFHQENINNFLSDMSIIYLFKYLFPTNKSIFIDSWKGSIHAFIGLDLDIIKLIGFKTHSYLIEKTGSMILDTNKSDVLCYNGDGTIGIIQDLLKKLLESD